MLHLSGIIHVSELSVADFSWALLDTKEFVVGSSLPCTLYIPGFCLVYRFLRTFDTVHVKVHVA